MADQLVPGDGVVSGHGLIDGRQVFAFAPTFVGGSAETTPRRSEDQELLNRRAIKGLNDRAWRIQG
jgi:propionyl-CoA carboxylase beta chain